MTTAYEMGRQAFFAGKSESDNPYISGLTKLGNPKFSDSEAGSDWFSGYLSAKPARIASKSEMDAAKSVDVSRFRRKANKFYR